MGCQREKSFTPWSRIWSNDYKFLIKKPIMQICYGKIFYLAKRDLSESMADPSSYSSSTTSGSLYSWSICEDDSDDFLRNIDLNTPFPCFLTAGGGATGFSWDNISTTMHVVSSLRPFACTASCNRRETCHKNFQLPLAVGTHMILIDLFGRQGHTLTICAAAASAGIPRLHSKAVSALKASQTPSLDIMSLPPPVESCRQKSKIIQTINSARIPTQSFWQI